MTTVLRKKLLNLEAKAYHDRKICAILDNKQVARVLSFNKATHVCLLPLHVTVFLPPELDCLQK